MGRIGLKRPLAEFVAIFAGVTLSLVADDWRTHRIDAADERSALELIHRDLVADSAELAFALRHPVRHERAGLWLREHWDSPDIRTDTIGLVLRPYLFANSYQLQRAAFTSLKESDRLTLIRNDTLRVAVIQYYEEAQINADQFLTGFGDEREETLKSLSRYIRWPEPRDSLQAWPVSGPMELMVPWDSVRRDNELYNRIASNGAIARLAQELGEDAQLANYELRQAIMAELGRQ